MPDIIDTIFRRRSIRRFQAKPVEHDKLDLLLRAAMAAPSACNSQPWEFIVVTWEFIVVTEAKVLDRLRDKLRFARYNAPAAIVVLGNIELANNSAAKRFWIQDCCAAIENILLAATGLDLGSVWIGVHPVPSFERHVRQILSIPEEVTPLSIVYVGYPDEEKAPQTKYDDRRIHWERYGPRKRQAEKANMERDTEE